MAVRCDLEVVQKMYDNPQFINFYMPSLTIVLHSLNSLFTGSGGEDGIRTHDLLTASQAL